VEYRPAGDSGQVACASRLRDVGTVDVILDARGPVADEVRRLTPYLRTHRLRWDDLRAFVELRQELFEIDTRFGQLG
jgi:hypothetical protein